MIDRVRYLSAEGDTIVIVIQYLFKIVFFQIKGSTYLLLAGSFLTYALGTLEHAPV
jgi:hypothetical protein